jgi:proteic killer suppression protein
MIESWRDVWLRNFFENDIRSKKIPSDLRDRLFRKLQLLDDATVDADLRIPPGNHFEKLGGTLSGWHSIRVNNQWRIVFQWSDGKASQTYLDDHSYR